MGVLSAGKARLAPCASVALLLVASSAAGDVDDTTGKAAVAPLFSRAVLLPAWLRALEADITFSADSVEWQGEKFEQARLPLAIHDGSLTVQQATVQLAGGELALNFQQDPAQRATLRLEARQLTLGQLAALRGYVSGTPVNVQVELRGNGVSLHDLAASASGRVALHNTGSGVIRDDFEQVGDNLVFHFIGAFEVFRRAGNEANLECLALELALENGLATDPHSMELRTRRLQVRGGGRVDLNGESLDLMFKPETRSTLKLQSLKAVETVRVQGRLAAPQVSIDSGPLVGRAVHLGIDVANLGGRAVLNRLLGRKPKLSLCGVAGAAPATPAVQR